MSPIQSSTTHISIASQWKVRGYRLLLTSVLRINGTLNHFIALLVPAIVVLIVGLYRLSFVALHHGVLALLAGRGMTRMFTNVLKNQVGQVFRPSGVPGLTSRFRQAKA